MRRLLWALAFVTLANLAARAQKHPTPDWVLVPPAPQKSVWIMSVDAMECATPPTLQQVMDADLKTRIEVMSTARAASLKISWFGSAGGSGSANEMVIVSQVARGAVCTAKDGKTQLLYGQTAFVTVLVGEWDAKLEVTFPIVAASATLKNRRYMVDAEVRGFPADVKVKFNEAKHAAVSGLTVENYATFIDKLKLAESAAVASTTGAVQHIGPVMDSATQALARGAVGAFALQMMSEGRGCLDATSRYPQKTPESTTLITDAYTTVTGGCGGVDDAHKRKARELLNGIRVQP